jgi:hypothetical protein
MLIANIPLLLGEFQSFKHPKGTTHTPSWRWYPTSPPVSTMRNEGVPIIDGGIIILGILAKNAYLCSG